MRQLISFISCQKKTTQTNKANTYQCVKKKYKNLFIVTPGIRLPGDKKNDQVRVVTPYEALNKCKANAIVMGRSLIQNNFKSNIKKLIDHLNQ